MIMSGKWNHVSISHLLITAAGEALRGTLVNFGTMPIRFVVTLQGKLRVKKKEPFFKYYIDILTSYDSIGIWLNGIEYGLIASEFDLTASNMAW